MLWFSNPILKIFIGFPRYFYITYFLTKYDLYQLHGQRIVIVNPLITSVWEGKLWKVKRKLSKFTRQKFMIHNNPERCAVLHEPCAVQQVTLLWSLLNHFRQCERLLKQPACLRFTYKCEQELFKVQFNIFWFLLQGFHWSSFSKKDIKICSPRKAIRRPILLSTIHMHWRTEQDVARW